MPMPTELEKLQARHAEELPALHRKEHLAALVLPVFPEGTTFSQYAPPAPVTSTPAPEPQAPPAPAPMPRPDLGVDEVVEVLYQGKHIGYYRNMTALAWAANEEAGFEVVYKGNYPGISKRRPRFGVVF